MDITMTTPALLFPAISLLLLAYTNRFNTLAGLVRQLYRDYCERPDPEIRKQIRYFQTRIRLIREMQFLGVASFFLCVLCMLLLVFGEQWSAVVAFVVSLIFLLGSLGISLWEIHMSAAALNLQLGDFDRPPIRTTASRDGEPPVDPNGGT